MPSIEVDFNNCDREGRVRLNTIGAIRSLNESKVTLRNGLEVELTSGDFFATKGTVEYSDSEDIWAAQFDINDCAIGRSSRHQSDDWRNISITLITVKSLDFFILRLDDLAMAVFIGKRKRRLPAL